MDRHSDPPPSRTAAPLLDTAAAGLASGAVVVGCWFVLYGLALAPFPPLDLADFVIRASPGAVATWAIEDLGHWAQRALRVGAVGVWLSSWISAVVALYRSAGRLSQRVLVPLALLPALALSYWSNGGLSPGALVWNALALGAPVVLGVRLLTRWLERLAELERERRQPAASWIDGPGDASRRALLTRIVAWGVLAGGGGALLGRATRQAETRQVSTAAGRSLEQLRMELALTNTAGTPVALPTPVPARQLPVQFAAPTGVEPRLTPLDRFYVVDINTRDPRLAEAEWSLRIHGLAERELRLSYAELLALPAVELHGTLLCISYEYGSALVSTTRWTGVPLNAVLERAGVRDGVVDLICRGAGGYSDSISLATALEPTTLLAYAMDGQALPTEHGFPCRLYVPGLYGEKNVKWLREIELAPVDYLGYWQDRGWTDIAVINTIAEIQVPRHDTTVHPAAGLVPVGGFAFAGTRGISRVELQVDDGPWQPAELERYEPPLVWQRWRWDWQASPGRHRLTVRATDGDGQIQTTEPREPHPDGMTGLHTIRVEVR